MTAAENDRPVLNYSAGVDSDVVAATPMFLGVSAALLATLWLSPIPPTARGIEIEDALRQAIVHVGTVFGIACVVLSVTRRAISFQNGIEDRRALLLPLCAIVVWFPPWVCLANRGSFWAFVPAVLFALTLHRLLLDRIHWPNFWTALLIQMAAVAALAQLPQWSSLLASIACIGLLLNARRNNRAASPQPPSYHLLRALGLLPQLLFSAALVFVSFTPYLAKKTTMNARGGPGAGFPMLEQWFGDSQPAPQPKRGQAISIVAGESYPGMILVPNSSRTAIAIPPPARPSIAKSTKTADPVTIPFFGVYWYFRTEDHAIPQNAPTVRGEPTATNFRTSDLAPLTMEAVQNLGRQVPISCCRRIEVDIRNADNRPYGVSLELILRNSGTPGVRSLSLGRQSVTRRPPKGSLGERLTYRETLSFPLAESGQLVAFDEFLLRYHSVASNAIGFRVAIDRFRLVR
jgi:hypothetical protein